MCTKDWNTWFPALSYLAIGGPGIWQSLLYVGTTVEFAMGRTVIMYMLTNNLNKCYPLNFSIAKIVPSKVCAPLLWLCTLMVMNAIKSHNTLFWQPISPPEKNINVHNLFFLQKKDVIQSNLLQIEQFTYLTTTSHFRSTLCLAPSKQFWIQYKDIWGLSGLACNKRNHIYRVSFYNLLLYMWRLWIQIQQLTGSFITH
jgi:hypothetical protein